MKTIKEIAQGNDLFRTTLLTSPRHRLNIGDSIRLNPDREDIISAVRMFKGFNEGNDPHGEHDFGAVEVNGTKYFWKMDYYDLDFNGGAVPTEEPYALLLTIMRADEY